MKKKVDPRIRETLRDAVSNNHRAVMVLVGDKSRDQVANLHYMLSKMSVQARPSVLWCYKKELGFSSSKKKRRSVINKRIKQGLVDPNQDDPFDLFLSATDIRYSYYSDSHKILGNTYGMCVLQDFEALTPNLLARTIETVRGGGLILILINNLKSLKQLFSLTMDVHSRFRTEAHSNVVPRFNERFILSLSDCPAAIVADDELNVLPISSYVRSLTGSSESDSNPGRLAVGTTIAKGTDASPELVKLKASLEDTLPVGPLVTKAKTIDQAKAILRFEEALSEKTLRTTVALTASRGRGKSAALGLAVAAAIAHDYSNIFVTSPSPENLRTFFAFLFIGFDALEFQEHTDYEIIHSTDPALNKAIVRVNIFRNHRQTVQYLDPMDAPRFLTQAELLVIDEAAAIPLPVVEAMLGPYVVFMASTITGYEGTGRSLSLKLIKKLRDGSSLKQAQGTEAHGHASKAADRDASAVTSRSGSGRVFREVNMETPIRYGEKDPVEHWLYDLLCLEAGGTRQFLTGGAPHPSECELYFVERDALFSRHQAAESFLHRIMGLFVSSHYKNSPNDLQMLSDAPAHRLFVLLAPTRKDTEKLPDVLCAIQVCLEGRISSNSSKTQLSRGQRASGDLIPWTISQQFQETEFATLSGARIVRVATHPDVQKMGYGTRAIQLLIEYFSGKIISLEDNEGNEDNDMDDVEEEEVVNSSGKKNSLLNEIIGPRKNIPPLLRRLQERPPDNLDYLGVSFGLTQGLYKFWSKLGFLPLYLRLTANDLTGEHTCIMATCSVSASEENQKWLNSYHQDFRRRFIHLLGYDFRKLSPGLGLAILEHRKNFWESEESEKSRKSVEEIRLMFSPYDRRRLESYARSLVDYHVVVDMLPKLAELMAMGGFGSSDEFRLSAAQFAILMALGLQRKNVEEVGKDLQILDSQVLALFNKVIRKISNFLREKEEKALADQIGPQNGEAALKVKPALKNMDEELQEAATDMNGSKETEKVEVRKSLEKFKVGGTAKEWEEALGKGERTTPQMISIKSKRKPDETVGGTQLSHKKKKKKKT